MWSCAVLTAAGSVSVMEKLAVILAWAEVSVLGEHVELCCFDSSWECFCHGETGCHPGLG